MKIRLHQLALIGLVMFIQGCVSARPAYVRYIPNTEPSGALIYREGQPEEKRYEYIHRITEADITAGRVELPRLVFEKSGFFRETITPAVITLDTETLQRLRNPSLIWHFNNESPIRLKKDPSYPGPENKNTLELTVNSEPRGARIYQDGAYMGVTPLKLTYTISNDWYRAKKVRCPALFAVHDACLPSRQDPEFQIDPDWRYESGQTHYYATLVLLNRDPNYRPPVVVQGQAPRQSDLNVNVKKDKDALDLLQQFGQVGIIIRSLQPIH